MYTIRHYDEGGHDSLTEAASTTYDPETNVLVAHGCPESENGMKRFDSGHAFVMNDRGATVAAYNFRLGPQKK